MADRFAASVAIQIVLCVEHVECEMAGLILSDRSKPAVAVPVAHGVVDESGSGGVAARRCDECRRRRDRARQRAIVGPACLFQQSADDEFIIDERRAFACLEREQCVERTLEALQSRVMGLGGARRERASQRCADRAAAQVVPASSRYRVSGRAPCLAPSCTPSARMQPTHRARRAGRRSRRRPCPIARPLALHAFRPAETRRAGLRGARDRTRGLPSTHRARATCDRPGRRSARAQAAAKPRRSGCRARWRPRTDPLPRARFASRHRPATTKARTGRQVRPRILPAATGRQPRYSRSRP